MNRRSMRLRLLLLSSMATSSIVTGQPARPIPPEHIVQMQTPCEIAPMAFSVDGSRLAYAVRLRKTEIAVVNDYALTGVPAFGVGCDIVVADSVNGESKNLTAGKADNWSPSWSPDGRLLAFLSDRDGSSHAKLWIWNRTNGEMYKASDLRIHMINTERIAWSTDGHRVLVGVAATNGARDENLVTISVDENSGKSTEQKFVRVYESPQEDRDRSDSVNLDRTLRSVVSLDVETGHTTVVVPVVRISLFRVSEDSKSVVYASPRRALAPGSQQLLYDLTFVDTETGSAKRIASEISLRNLNAFSLSPDGRVVAFRVQDNHHEGMFWASGETGKMGNACGTDSEPDGPKIRGFDEWGRRKRPFSSIPLWSADGRFLYWISNGDLWGGSKEGKCERVANIKDHAIQEIVTLSAGLVFSPANSVIAVTRDATESDGFYRIDLSTGDSHKLLERGECYTARCFTLAEGHVAAVARSEDKIAYVAQDAQHWPEIWMSTPDFVRPRRLTKLNSSLDGFPMGPARQIDWLDDDGVLLHGALLLPPNYREGSRCPLVVMLYGGVPLSESVDQFGGYFGPLGYLNAQLFVSRGMAVLLPDAPQHVGTAMRDLAKTVLPGVNKVIEMGIADPDRLGVVGHSYGGYSTLSLIVQTGRFKAAVETAGVADLIAMYGEMTKAGEAFGTLAEHGQSLMGGTPWSHRDRYIENSPIFYLDAIHTPLLIVQGADDTTTASFLGDEIFVGLRRLGATVSYAKYEGEGHVINVYADRLDAANRVIAWFEKYLSQAGGL